jgi:hypothetical protein
MEECRVITHYGNNYNGEKPNTFSYVGHNLSESFREATFSFQILPLEVNYMLLVAYANRIFMGGT